MKTKTRKIITISAMILLVIIVQMIGTTYARYLTKEKGTGSANIAKWGFEVVKDVGYIQKTVSLTNEKDKSSLKTGKIAPGTSGIIELVVDAKDSEVGVNYQVNFLNELNKPTNLKFTYNGIDYDSLSKITSVNGTIEPSSAARTKTIKISWEWPYRTGTTEEEKLKNDEIDTQDARIIDEYKFDIEVIGTQQS